METKAKTKIITVLITGAFSIASAYLGSAVTNNMVTSEVQNITNVDTGDTVDIVREQTERAVSAEAEVEELKQNISELEKKLGELQESNSEDKSSNDVVQESSIQETDGAISFSKMSDILYDGSGYSKYAGDGSFKADNSSQTDATLYIYSGDNPIGEYQLSGNKTFQTVELEVTGIDTLILELKTDEYGGKYGFFDIEFYK